MKSNIHKVFIFFALTLLLSCSGQKEKTYVVVVFDVEDYITPVSEGIDNIPKWLAETMSEEGVTGTFFVIGEKARSLEIRGRRDVIDAIAKHDIGSHTNRGSIHPTVTEQLEMAGWDGGVRLMIEQESAGFDELKRIFAVPVRTLSRHGGSYGPQLVYALGTMGAGYVYSPIHLPGHNAVWFCNTLNFHGEYGGFDDSYYRDELFEPLYDSLQVWFPKLVEESDVISFFGCHPCKVRTEQFWDFNYYKGANPDSNEWKTPELRPMESMQTARNNFRLLMRYLKGRKDIEITTYRHLMEIYSKQKETITSDDLAGIAERILDKNMIIMDDYYSPSEIFAALTEYVVDFSSEGKIQNKLRKMSPLGPMSMPSEEPEIPRITIKQVYSLAQKAQNHIQKHGVLPVRLNVADYGIGTGSLLALFCAVYRDIYNESVEDEYNIIAFDAYPKTNESEIVKQVRGCKNWRVHRPDLDMIQLVELTKLQLWTLKPAHVL